ncbi:MAG: hypothetical protein LRY54_04530 [Alphaproteobacteria bacterium]|nr:hypothetical protein [Alphaproteobacteria bacterium]
MDDAKSKKGFLSSLFSWSTVGTIAWGLAMFWVGGLVDFTFFHNNELGKQVIRWIDPFMQNIYDHILSFVGLTQYVQNPAFLNPITGAACATSLDALGMPIPCN